MFSLNSHRFFILIIIFSMVLFSANTYAHWADDVLNDFKSQGYLLDLDSTLLDTQVCKGEIASTINQYYNLEEEFISYDKSLQIAKDKGYLQNAIAEDMISREEFAVLVCKLISEDDISFDTEIALSFNDKTQITDYVRPYVFRLSSLNIIKGYPNGDFKPHNLLTYAELITTLSRIQGIGGNNVELIDEEIDKVTLKVLDFESGDIITKAITGNLILQVDDKLEIAVLIPDSIDESKIEYQIADEDIAKFDEEFNLLIGLKEGSTQMKVMYQGEVQQEFEIFVNIKEEQ